MARSYFLPVVVILFTLVEFLVGEWMEAPCKEDIKEICGMEYPKTFSTVYHARMCLRMHEYIVSEECINYLRFESPSLIEPCFDEIALYCKHVEPGGNRIHECLNHHIVYGNNAIYLNKNCLKAIEAENREQITSNNKIDNNDYDNQQNEYSMHDLQMLRDNAEAASVFGESDDDNATAPSTEQFVLNGILASKAITNLYHISLSASTILESNMMVVLLDALTNLLQKITDEIENVEIWIENTLVDSDEFDHLNAEEYADTESAKILAYQRKNGIEDTTYEPDESLTTEEFSKQVNHLQLLKRVYVQFFQSMKFPVNEVGGTPQLRGSSVPMDSTSNGNALN